MTDKVRRSCPAIFRSSFFKFHALRRLSVSCVILSSAWASAQTPSAGAYPIDPAAAAGMATSTTNATSSLQLQMMQIRSNAQQAQGEAVAASMARTADRTIDEQNQDRVLQQAREEKAIKRQMAERVKWERNSAQVRKVSANDMSFWNQNGGVRVERNVPDPFITSLIEEERQLAAQERAEKTPGIGPFGKVKLNPFKKDKFETHVPGLMEAMMDAQPQAAPAPAAPGMVDPNMAVSSEPSGGGGGFFSKLRPPKIGRGREEASVDASGIEPQFAQGSSVGNSAPEAPASKPGTIPRISGAELVDGSSPVNSGSRAASTQSAAPAQAPSTPAGQQVSFADEMPDASGSRSGVGLFSKLKSNGGRSTASAGSSGGGLFSFGKKKQAAPAPGIDASLFPAGASAQFPTGGSLGRAYTTADVAGDSVAMPSSTGSVQLPGTEVEKPSRGFSITPSSSGRSRSSNSSGVGAVPTSTTFNSSGNDYYVTTGTAQMMVYGENQMQSEVRAVPAGMIVRMTKPGENWVGIRLSNGTDGIVQKKFLRPASASEAGSQFTP